jgi:hypothetical protein
MLSVFLRIRFESIPESGGLMFPSVKEKGVMIQPSETVILFEGFLRSFCLRCFCLVGFRTLRRGAGCLFDGGFDGVYV